LLERPEYFLPVGFGYHFPNPDKPEKFSRRSTQIVYDKKLRFFNNEVVGDHKQSA